MEKRQSETIRNVWNFINSLTEKPFMLWNHWYISTNNIYVLNIIIVFSFDNNLNIFWVAAFTVGQSQ